MVDVSSSVKTGDDIRYRVVDGEAVVLSQSAGEIVVLDAVGSRVLELVAEGCSVASLVERMHGEYDVDRETLEADVVAFLEELLEARIVVETPPRQP